MTQQVCAACGFVQKHRMIVCEKCGKPLVFPKRERPMVDTHSYDLAEFFLGEIPGSTEDDIWELARLLQIACEDACREVEERQKPKEPQ